LDDGLFTGFHINIISKAQAYLNILNSSPAHSNVILTIDGFASYRVLGAKGNFFPLGGEDSIQHSLKYSGGSGNKQRRG